MVRNAVREHDNPALCALAQACPQGERLRFHYQRTDFWERCRLFPESTVLVSECNNEVVGAAALAHKQLWLQGKLRRVAYLFDRMVHPAHRRQGIGRALLQAQQTHTTGAALRYCLVLEENRPNRRLLEGEGFACHPQRLLYFTILPRLIASSAGMAQHPISPSAQHDSRLYAQYEFVDPLSDSGDSLWHDPGSGATAIIHRAIDKVFTDAAWHHRFLSRLLPFVPALGRPVASWLLTHIDGRSPEAVARLIRGVAWAGVRSGVDLLLLPLYENDPRIRWIQPLTIHRFGLAAPARVCLYLNGPLAGVVLTTTRSLLASARDG